MLFVFSHSYPFYFTTCQLECRWRWWCIMVRNHWVVSKNEKMNLENISNPYFSSGNFQRYDYGLIKNLQKYKTVEPPCYNVSAISAPVALYYSTNDLLVGLKVGKKGHSSKKRQKDKRMKEYSCSRSFRCYEQEWNVTSNFRICYVNILVLN